MTDYLEEFRARIRKIDEEYAEDMRKINRQGRLAGWLLGGVVALYVIVEIVIAVVWS